MKTMKCEMTSITSLQIESSSTISLETISKVILTIGDFDVFYVHFLEKATTPKHLVAGFLLRREEKLLAAESLYAEAGPVKGRFMQRQVRLDV